MPSSTAGAYDTYDWSPDGTLTGPSPESVDAGTPTFTVDDINWSGIAAQIVAAPSLVGLPNGSVMFIVAEFAVTGGIEGTSVTVFVMDGGVTKFVRMDATGQVLVTG